MEILKYIIPPIIGALIGYCTNYIAVKMLFRPHNAIKIKGKTLPFTPGIIPKRKPKLAKALGQAVGTQLFNIEDIKEILISESMQNSVKGYIETAMEDTKPLKNHLSDILTDDNYNKTKEKATTMLTNKILNSLESANIGQIISKGGQEAIKEKVSGTMIAMFVNDKLIASLCESLATKANEYITINGNEIISPIVSKEIEKIEESSINNLIKEFDFSEKTISDIAKQIYIKFIEENADKLLKNFNISEIVEQKVNAMEVAELEKLLLSVMKKELNAVVNLGAVIGFILGLINILF